MTNHIHPATLEKLREFAGRRRTLIVARGCCAAFVILLVTMAVVAVFDWLFFISGTVLTILSLLAYAGTLLGTWLTCGRWLFFQKGQSHMARLVESTHPQLREDLTSAVELGMIPSDGALDSPEFRQLVQDNVAARTSDIHVPGLLPTRLIRRWLGGALTAFVILTILVVAPGLHSAQRLARVMLPMFSIARVSQTQIAILKPSPSDIAVPRGDSIEVVVELTGKASGSDLVELETAREGKGRQRVTMAPQGDDGRRFVTTVRVGQEDVNYRIRANDAQSAHHMILSRERPHVVSFAKEYRYPDYTLMPSITFNDKEGDVAAVEGSTVQLTIQTSQAISTAHLEVSFGEESNQVPLNHLITASGTQSHLLSGVLHLKTSGSYRVKLVAAETGFDNKFSPDHVIRAEPDFSPTIVITEPGAEILVPRDEIVIVKGQIDDDWGLARLDQTIILNNHPPVILPRVTLDEIVKQYGLSFAWDLEELSLKEGDIIVTHFTAIDRKGQQVESQPLRLVISSDEFQPGNLNSLLAAQAIRESMKSTLDLVSGLVTNVQQLNPRQDQAERATVFDDNASSIQAVNNGFDQSSQLIQSTLSVPSVPAHLALARLGMAVTRNESEHFHLLRTTFSNLEQADLITDRMIQSARGEAKRIQQSAEETLDPFETIIKHNELATVSSQLIQARAAIEKAIFAASIDQVSDESKNKRVGRRIGAALDQLQVIDPIIKDLTERYDITSLDSIVSELEEIPERLRDTSALETAPRLDRLLEKTLSRTLIDYRKSLRPTSDARAALAIQSGNLETPASKAHDKLSNYILLKENLSRLTDQGDFDGVEKTVARIKQTRSQIQHSLQSAVYQLSRRIDIERSLANPDHRFVSDLNKALQATQTVARLLVQPLAKPRENAPPGDLSRIALAVGTIDAIHRIDQMIVGLDRIQSTESQSSPQRLIASSIEWAVSLVDFDTTIAQLERNQLSDEAQRVLDDSRHSREFELVDRELVRRPSLSREPKPIEPELAKLQSDLKTVRTLLGDDLAAAREILNQSTPQLKDLLAQAAEQARMTEAELRESQLAADDEEMRQRANDDRDRVQELASTLDDLREALVNHANEQDVMSKEGREQMRDADDALAMLTHQPDESLESIDEALQSQNRQDQQQALEQARINQERLAENLEQLAQHFDRLDNNQEPIAREMLRAQEEEQGVREQLDQEYERLERLADLGSQSPEDALASLEEQLATDEQMRQELDNITREQLSEASENLDLAAQNTDNLREQLEARQRTSDLNEQLNEIRDESNQIAQDRLESLDRTAESQPEENAKSSESAAGEDDEASEQNDPPNNEVDQPANEARERMRQALDQLQESDPLTSDLQRPPTERNVAREAQELAQQLAQAAQELEQAVAGLPERNLESENEDGVPDRQPPADQESGAEQQQGPPNEDGSAESEQNRSEMPPPRSTEERPDRDNARQPSNSQEQEARPENSQSQQQAESTGPREIATETAQELNELAERAEAIAEQLDNIRDQIEQLADADRDPSLTEQLEEISDELAQAARNEARLNRQERSEEIERIAEQTDQLASQSDPSAPENQSDPELGEDVEQLAENQQSQPGEQPENMDRTEQNADAQQPEAGSPPGQQPEQNADAQQPEAGSPPGQQPQQNADAQQPEAGSPPGQQPEQNADAQQPEAGSPPGQQPEQNADAEQPEAGSSPGQQPQSDASPAEQVEQIAEALQAQAEDLAELSNSTEPVSGENSSQPGSEPSASQQSEQTGQPQSSQSASSEPGNQTSESNSDQSPTEQNSPEDNVTGQPTEPSQSQSSSPSQQPASSGALSSSPADEPGQSSLPSSPSSPSRTPSSEVARQLAEALYELDEAINGSQSEAPPSSAPNSGSPSAPAQEGAQPAQSSAQPATQSLGEAIQAQAQSLANNRSQQSNTTPNPNSTPSQSSRSYAEISRGSSIEEGSSPFGRLIEVKERQGGNWAKLRKKDAKDLFEGTRESLSPEYRNAIEAYFKIIAERSRSANTNQGAR